MTSQKRIDAGLYWDRAWGLVEGCSPVSPGCDHCWAGAQAHIRACQKNEKIKTANEGLTDDHGTFNGTVRFRHDLLDLPFETKKPTVWSIWTDLFHEGVQEKSISDAISIMHISPNHIFLALTKRVERMKRVMSVLNSFHGRQGQP